MQQQPQQQQFSTPISGGMVAPNCNSVAGLLPKSFPTAGFRQRNTTGRMTGSVGQSTPLCRKNVDASWSRQLIVRRKTSSL